MALSEADAVQVRSIHLFKSLSEPSLPTLLKSASIKQFPARAELLSEGDRATTLYTLLQGSIELFSEHHDRRSSMAVNTLCLPQSLAILTPCLHARWRAAIFSTEFFAASPTV
jgi:hypothetical protein